MACDLSGGDRVVGVVLPPLPRVYLPFVSHWRLSWWDGREVRAEAIDFSAHTAEIKLDYQGSEIVVVHLQPVVDLVGMEIKLDQWGWWSRDPGGIVAPLPAEGVVAGILLRCAERGIDPALVNVERLSQRLALTGRNELKVVDGEHLFGEIMRGELSYYGLRELDRPACTVELAGDEGRAEWISDSVWEGVQPPVVADQVYFWRVEVSRGGVRYWWRETAPEERRAYPYEVLSVSRDREDHARWYIRPVGERPSP